MKKFLAKIEELEPVPSTEYPELNVGYNTKRSYYGVIEENQPIDDELVRVTFVAWADQFSDDKIKQLLTVLNDNHPVS